MKTLLFLTDGFEEIEALATVDILRRAGIVVTTVSTTGKVNVVGKNAVEVKADALFEEVFKDDADMLIIPGGPGVANLDKHQGLKELIKEYNQKGKWIAAICAAPTILGKLGLLEEKNAICYPGCENDLTRAKLLDLPVVVDGNIITSKGPGTAFQFAFKIVEILKGKEKAEDVSKGMCYSL